MSQRSDISASIQQNFPNNTTNFITPTRLRDEQGLFQQYSVLNEQTASYATTGSNTFDGTQYYGASGSYPSIAVDIQNNTTITNGWSTFFDYSQLYFVSTSTIEFGAQDNAAYQNGMYFRKNAFLIFTSGSIIYARTGSTDTTGSNGQVLGNTNGVVSWITPSTGSGTVNTGSLVTTASFNAYTASTNTFTGSALTTASVSLNTITFTKGDGSTFPITVNTGSAGGMNLGENTFTGSQTIQSASLLLQGSSSIALNTNFFTASTAGAIDGANVYMFAGSANSGSVAISGSRNIGTVSQLLNTFVPARFGGFSGSGNFGTFSNTYLTSSRAPILTNNNQIGAIAFLVGNTTASATLSNNYIGGNITITGSSVLQNNISNNSIDNVTIENNFSGSGASQSISVQNNIIKGGAGNLQALIKFGSTTPNTNSRPFNSSILIGSNITASLEASGGVGGLYNTAIIGGGLIVSGTMGGGAGATVSASMFVGQYNETGSLAEANQIKFAVGAGTSNTARKTAFYVSASGEVVIRPNGDNQGITTILPGKIARIQDGMINGSLSTVAVSNATFNTNGCTISAGQTGTVIGSEVSTITTNALVNTIIGGYTSDIINGGTATSILGALSSVVSASDYCSIIASSGSRISNAKSSLILGGSNVRLQGTTGSVALDRATEYTGSANYTLFTQNINASGSVSVTGSATVTGDVRFASGSNTTMGTFVLDGGNPGVATVSNSLVSANSLIFLTKQTNVHSGNGTVSVTSKGTGTFSVTSNHNGDTDTVAYLIINPA